MFFIPTDISLKLKYIEPSVFYQYNYFLCVFIINYIITKYHNYYAKLLVKLCKKYPQAKSADIFKYFTETSFLLYFILLIYSNF